MVKIKKIASLLLVALYLSYYASTTFFFHKHTYSWGEITHSHPYTSGTHTHGVNTLQFIGSLTLLFFIGGVFMLFWVLPFVLKAVSFFVAPWRSTSLLVGSNLLRAPPAGI